MHITSFSYSPVPCLFIRRKTFLQTLVAHDTISLVDFITVVLSDAPRR
ncbi:hypothetical protein HMPREF0083_03982 [Aneurinibacillus aneurinilyticus ATCC 12856]|uniref:Uncharacterized protein n=1 Tax=Aneurinibacillus aneurinilyticus ATCC 12856 TaxID=649747 RepID=U1WHC1_ANEAE|nr:hypothetical protein HMPREF0083_03982 [Aneurinibacillus aneurinilyticus ATCC 12856]